MESILNSTLRIDYEWLPSEYGSCEERVTLADVAIFVRDHCATELDDSVAKTVRRSARLSALHMAQWFATNWWRLLWQPRIGDLSWQMSHKIGGAGGGYIWPDLSFSSNWESILVSSSRTEQSEAEPIRYLNDFSLSVPIGDFEKCIAQFIGGTVARLSETLKEETELSVLWREVMSERRDRDMSRLRKLEACMGYDPDEAPDELLHTLNAAANPYGDEAVHELAAAYRSETISQIEVLAEQARRQALRVRVSSYDVLRRRITEEIDRSNPPWERAREAAQIARDVWNLEGPVPTSVFSDLFEMRESELAERNASRARPLSVALRDDEDPSSILISWNTRSPAGRRFLLTRLVADHLASRAEERLLPATQVATSRQQFQRAFAQEFLCPYDRLKEMIGTDAPDEDDIECAAEHFDVSTWVIVCTLVNNHALPRQALADWGVSLSV